MPRNSGADELVNVGRARELTIREFAETVMSAIGYRCAVVFGPSKLRGAPRKLVDVTRLNSVGWQPRVFLKAIEAMCECSEGTSSTSTVLPRLCQPESVLRVPSKVGVNPSITVFYFNEFGTLCVRE